VAQFRTEVGGAIWVRLVNALFGGVRDSFHVLDL
jgi:hypothetical protein